VTWQQAQLKYVTRFNYGNALPSTDEERQGLIKVFGSNGPYARFSQANTGAPTIVIGRKGSYGKINWSDEPVFASDTTFFVDTTTTRHHLRWLFYTLQTLNLDEGSDEAAVPGLNRDKAYQKEILIPPLSEQRAIAAYLDRETTRLDVLIAAKEELLTLLAEKRRALISHAVTRGLNPAAPLRDSEVEWLGEIPAHWDPVRVKHLAQLGNGSTPLRDNKTYWQDGTFPWLTSTMVNDDIIGEPTQFVTETALRECHLPIVQPNSVLVAITGQGKTRGKAAVLRYPATINQHLAFISPQVNNLSPEFLQLFLTSSYEVLRVISEGMGSTRGALTIEQLGEFFVPVPPLAEQEQIVSTVGSMVAKIDSLIQAIEETNGLLYERRAALISAAVSGQIPVTE
jgi:type I restriction enzyme S subunit